MMIASEASEGADKGGLVEIQIGSSLAASAPHAISLSSARGVTHGPDGPPNPPRQAHAKPPPPPSAPLGCICSVQASAPLSLLRHCSSKSIHGRLMRPAAALLFFFFFFVVVVVVVVYAFTGSSIDL